MRTQNKGDRPESSALGVPNIKPRVNDYLVYLHRDPTSGTVFYVGEGRSGRPWEASSRSPEHQKSLETLFSLGFNMAHITEVHRSRMTKDEAVDLEGDLIELFDLRTLENKANGRKKKSAKRKVRAEISREFFKNLKPVKRATHFHGSNLVVVQYSTGRVSIWASATGPEGRKKVHVWQLVPGEAITLKMISKIKKLHQEAIDSIKEVSDGTA
jgi:hypothetical protein